MPSILVLILLSAPLLCECVTPAATTTSGTVLIRRRLPAGSRSDNGGRYSLLNSRVNRRLKKKNLDRAQLLDILGSHFDARWMAPDLPPGEDQLPESLNKESSWQRAELTRQLQRLNLTSQLGERDAREVGEWLIKRATCPVRYAWEDIGPLFWPRFVRLGSCPSTPGTCSWPPGMHCVPARTTTLHVLRWQCKAPRTGSATRHNRPRKNYPKDQQLPPVQLRCSWIVVPYPVTSDCMCTC